MQRILIVDNSDAFRQTLAQALRRSYQVDCCETAEQALEFLHRAEYALMILDLMLPGPGGLGVLEAAAKAGLCPTAIVTSRFLSDYVLNTLTRFPVEYVASKPCAVEALAERVDDMIGCRPECLPQPQTPRAVLQSALHELNFSSKPCGYHYLIEGALMLAHDPCQRVTKEIYPVIAQQHKTSVTAVEKAIRNAIESAWKHRTESVWRGYFNPGPLGTVPKPTNSQMMASLAELVPSLRQRRIREA